MTCKEEQFDVVELMDLSINLNAQHVNGTTHFNLPEHVGKCTVIRGFRVRTTPPKRSRFQIVWKKAEFFPSLATIMFSRANCSRTIYHVNEKFTGCAHVVEKISFYIGKRPEIEFWKDFSRPLLPPLQMFLL